MNINFQNRFFQNFPFSLISSISAEFTFESDLTDYKGKLKVRNDLGLNMVGNFELKSDTGFIRLNQLELAGNDAVLSLNGLTAKHLKHPVCNKKATNHIEQGKSKCYRAHYQ